MKVPKDRKTYCKKCNKHTLHTISIYKKGRERAGSLGARRHAEDKKGYGGQKFIEQSYQKIARLREMCDNAKLDPLIEVDGGVDLTNAAKLFQTGVNILVTGTTIFESGNPKKMISDLKKAK